MRSKGKKDRQREKETHSDDGNTLKNRENITRKGNKKSEQLIEILRI